MREQQVRTGGKGVLGIVGGNNLFREEELPIILKSSEAIATYRTKTQYIFTIVIPSHIEAGPCPDDAF